MATRLILLIYVYSIIVKISVQRLESPCPRLFVYEPPGKEADRWYGIVTLISDSDLSGVWLRLIFDRRSLQLGGNPNGERCLELLQNDLIPALAVLYPHEDEPDIPNDTLWYQHDGAPPHYMLSNWFGEVVTEDNTEYLVKNRNHKLPANTPYPLRFYIKYDTSQPMPQLVGFRLNAKTVCPEGQTTTAPTPASSQLFTNKDPGATSPLPPSQPAPPPERPPSRPSRPARPSGDRPSYSPNSDDEDDYFQGDFSGVNIKPVGIESNVECGTIARRSKRQVYYYYPEDDRNKYQSTQSPYYGFYQYINSIVNALGHQQVQPRPLITYGQKTKVGEFPWHAALYHSRGVGLNYICGGSLISPYHVVTVAHCVSRSKSQSVLNPENLLVYLGKYYLKKWSSPGIQDHQVSKIIRHPQYDSKTYSNDIAVVRLAHPSQFTDFVRPVCLWGGNMDFNQLVGKFGTVVGWGFDENGKLTEELTMLNMPIVSKESCIYSFPDFFSRFTTSETFCAGFTNGTSVCNGDSGGGLVLLKETSVPNRKVYQLRGLVSVSVALQNQFKCDPTHYVVFTDVAKYLDFIKQAMAE